MSNDGDGAHRSGSPQFLPPPPQHQPPQHQRPPYQPQYQPQYQPYAGNNPGAPAPSNNSVLWIVLGVVGAVVLCGVGAVVAFFLWLGNEVSDTVEALPTFPAPTPEPTFDDPFDMGDKTADPESAHALGTPQQVADYTVTISSLVPDATQALVAAGNVEPTNGQYALLTVAGTYSGQGVGLPGLELALGVVSADGSVYSADECPATPDNWLVGLGTVEPGQEFAGDVCVDVPAGALDGGVLYVEPLFSEGDETVYFHP